MLHRPFRGECISENDNIPTITRLSYCNNFQNIYTIAIFTTCSGPMLSHSILLKLALIETLYNNNID